MSDGAEPVSWRKLGLVAGGGALPLRIAEACAEAGRPVFVVGLEGFAEPAGLARHPHAWAGLGEVGKLIEHLRTENCDAVAFAGNVTRPDFSALKVDWRGAKLLPAALAAARKGDDALLRVVLGAFEKEGFRVVGADEAAAALRAPEGPLGRTAPGDADEADIALAFTVAGALGAYDVGQGAVVCDGLVLAVEAQEGTDRMLARVAELPEEIRGASERRRGVLAKLPKPGQERRVDLPTVGVRTIEGIVRAGLAGVAVEADGALIIDREAVIETADAHGVFVVGVNAGRIPRP